MIRTAIDIISDIQDAAMERSLEFGSEEKHAIKQWPLSPEEYDVLMEHLEDQCRWLTEDVHDAEGITINTQFGAIAIRKMKS